MSADAMQLAELPALDTSCFDAARRRQQELTKPPGSLGRLEALVQQMAGHQAMEFPAARPCHVLLFAADHPVTRHGVSPYPSAVTRAMVDNFASGGAAASVLARSLSIPLHVFDVGVEREGQGGAGWSWVPAGDLRVEDALTRGGMETCVDAGRRAIDRYASDARVVLLGEMGIGNTTAAAAVAAALLGVLDPAEMVGHGTGAEGPMLRTKCAVVREAVARVGGNCEPAEILRRLGGREMAALFGALHEALSRRMVVLIDGFIVTTVAAVLIERMLRARDGMVFCHQSAERGHRALLTHLDQRPLLDLGMRLGEGSGALTAFGIVEQACALHRNMATFDSAGVPEEKT